MKDSKREFEEKLLKLCVKALILGREELDKLNSKQNG